MEPPRSVSPPVKSPLHTDPHQYKTDQARSLIRQGRFDEAEKLLNQLLETDPGNPQAHLAKARLHHNEGNTKKARDAVLTGLEANPDHRELLEEAYVYHLLTGDPGSALDACQKLIDIVSSSREPDDEAILRARLGIARAYHISGDSEKIAEAFERIIEDYNRKLEQKPGDSILLREKAALLRVAGLHGDALNIYQSIDEVEKVNLFIPLQVGRVLMEMGEHDKAREHFEEVINNHRDNFRAYRNMGWYMEEMAYLSGDAGDGAGYYRRARDYYIQARDLSPLPVDRAFLQLKVAQAQARRWAKTNSEKDRQQAMKDFDDYLKEAPPWLNTDAARPWIAPVREGSPGMLPAITREEIEIHPVVK